MWFDLSHLGEFRSASVSSSVLKKRQRNEEGLGYEPLMAWTDKKRPSTLSTCTCATQQSSSEHSEARFGTWAAIKFGRSVTWGSVFQFRIAMRGECGIPYWVPYRHCIAIGIPYSVLFPLKRGVSEIRIPDSSSVSQCYRDTEFIPCSGLAGSGIGCSGSRCTIVRHWGCQGGVLWGNMVPLPFGHQLQDPPPQTTLPKSCFFWWHCLWRAAWLDTLLTITPWERYLLKLKLTVAACIVQANHPIEQNYLIPWAIGGIFPPQVFPTRLRRS